METTFEKIVRKTGMKQRECKCKLCKSQCASPCKGTPEDMVKLLASGFQNKIMKTTFQGTSILTPLYDSEKKSCVFFTDGLCELHDLGLKPTEGKLSHHSTTFEKFNYKKSVSYHILKEWQSITKEQWAELVEKYIPTKQDSVE